MTKQAKSKLMIKCVHELFTARTFDPMFKCGCCAHVQNKKKKEYRKKKFRSKKKCQMKKKEKMQSPSLHVLAAKKLKECKSLKKCLFVYLSVCSLLRLFVCQFSSLMAQISTGNNCC
jgi:hypothetical protein